VGWGILVERFFVNTVGQKGNEDTIANDVRKQVREEEYKQPHRESLELFDAP
jgi:hypothetical protein